MNFKKLLATTFAVALLAGCNTEGNSSKPSSSSNGGTSSSSPVVSTPAPSISKPSLDSTQKPSTPDVPIIEEYMVRIRTTTGVNVVSSATKAAKGEEVTLTVTLEPGYSLEELTVNNQKLTPVVNGETYTYTFVMPDVDVTIKTKVSVEGEVTLTGDIAVPLALQEDGVIYAAFDVEVDTDSYIAFQVGGESLSIVTIDRTRSFANIDLAHDKDGGFRLAGGAKYDFFYNPELGEECCYIQRKEVTRYPSDSNSLWSLFDGSVKSDPSVYPSNLIGVNYSNTSANVDYEWKLYNDNSSFATIKRLGSNTVLSNVSKKIENGVYKVVDTYIESTHDVTKKDDTRAYSAKYSLVDVVASEFGNQQMTENEAEFEVRNPSHDTYSIDFDIMNSYRNGFDTEYDDTLKAYTQNIVSTPNADGSFKVNIDSSKTYESSGQTVIQSHVVYKVELNFGKAGEILSGTYLEKQYNNTEYDFTGLKFFPGGEYGGIEVKTLEFEYTYGEPTENNVEFDDSKYFAQSIEASIHNNDLYPNAKNTLNQTDFVDDYLEIEAEPVTALDLWQYRVTETSNPNVIAPRESFIKRFYAKNIGVSTLTIGNDSTNDVTTKVEVTVAQSIKVMSFFMQGESNGRPVYDNNIFAVKANILANTVKTVFVSPSPDNAPVTFTATSENEELLKVSVSGQIMTIDTTGAKDITTNTEVKITIHSDFYESYEGFKETTFIITIIPNAIPSTGIIGTWENASEGVSVTFTDTPSTYTSIADYKVAYVTYSGGSNIEFAYKFDPTSGLVTISGSYIAGNTFAGTFYFNTDGTISGCLCFTEDDWSTGEIYVSDIIGEFYEDEEGFFDDVHSEVVTLTKK